MGAVNSFKGFESVFSAIRMFWKMTVILVLFCLIIQVSTICSFIYFKHDSMYGKMDKTDICLIRTYYSGRFLYSISIDKSKVLINYSCENPSTRISYQNFVRTFQPYIDSRLQVIKAKTIALISWSSFVYLLMPIMVFMFNRKSKKDSKDRFIRGARIVNSDELNSLVSIKSGKEFCFKISPRVSIPQSIVTRHSFVIGKPGTGKTQLIARVIEQIIKNNFRAIIHDFKGDFINSFYDFKKHYIFNPLDKRHMGLRDREMALIEKLAGLELSDLDRKYAVKIARSKTGAGIKEKVLENFSFSELLDEINEIYSSILPGSRYSEIEIKKYEQKNYLKGWSIFNEIKSPVDIDAFCASLIPESASHDNFWPISSRQLLGSIITYSLHKGQTSYEELWKLVNLGNEELLPLFQSTPGCEEGVKLLTEAKTANNILAVLSNYTKPIKYLKGTDGAFSIKGWVKDPNPDKRIIFLSNVAMIQETIKPFLTMFVDFSTKTLCSLDDDLNRRLYFILDEFGQLSKIGSIISLLTQSRSKGGAAFILIQDIAQISSTYGKDGCTSIVNSCGNTISFAVSDESTADFISKKIGTMEVKRSEENKSMGVDSNNSSISISHQTTEKRLVMPSEVMSVPTMNFYVQLTDYPVTKDKLDYIKFPKITESYLERGDLMFAQPKKDSTTATGASSSTTPTLVEDPEFAQTKPFSESKDETIHEEEKIPIAPEAIETPEFKPEFLGDQNVTAEDRSKDKDDGMLI